MNLGAEPKKIAILAVLLVAAAVGLYMNMSGDSTSSSAPVAPRVATPVATTEKAPVPARAKAVGRVATEFRPRVGGAQTDPNSIDPELKLDLLAKVQAVAPIEAGRNLFQFGAAPPPPGPMPTVPKNVQPIPVTHAPTPPPTAVTSAGPPAPPPAPPINLKYYGYQIMKSDGRKVALLADGDDIIQAAENETVKKRYRIVRIALTTITIEDTQAKSTQTLTLQDLPG